MKKKNSKTFRRVNERGVHLPKLLPHQQMMIDAMRRFGAAMLKASAGLRPHMRRLSERIELLRHRGDRIMLFPGGRPESVQRMTDLIISTMEHKNRDGEMVMKVMRHRGQQDPQAKYFARPFVESDTKDIPDMSEQDNPFTYGPMDEVTREPSIGLFGMPKQSNRLKEFYKDQDRSSDFSVKPRVPPQRGMSIPMTPQHFESPFVDNVTFDPNKVVDPETARKMCYGTDNPTPDRVTVVYDYEYSPKALPGKENPETETTSHVPGDPKES